MRSYELIITDEVTGSCHGVCEVDGKGAGKVFQEVAAILQSGGSIQARSGFKPSATEAIRSSAVHLQVKVAGHLKLADASHDEARLAHAGVQCFELRQLRGTVKEGQREASGPLALQRPSFATAIEPRFPSRIQEMNGCRDGQGRAPRSRHPWCLPLGLQMPGR